MAAGPAPVSYSREIAPLLAFHCHRCHEGPGLDTRSYVGLVRGGNLGPAVVAGDPERSLLVQFVEGRRGEARRMPLAAPPLEAEKLALIRRWVAEGAREDPDTTAKYQVKLERVRRGRLEVQARSPVAAYLVVSVRDGDRVLLERAAAGVSGRWTLQPERGWPRRLTVVLTIAYAAAEPVGSTLTVNGRVVRFSNAFEEGLNGRGETRQNVGNLQGVPGSQPPRDATGNMDANRPLLGKCRQDQVAAVRQVQVHLPLQLGGCF